MELHEALNFIRQVMDSMRDVSWSFGPVTHGRGFVHVYLNVGRNMVGVHATRESFAVVGGLAIYHRIQDGLNAALRSKRSADIRSRKLETKHQEMGYICPTCKRGSESVGSRCDDCIIQSLKESEDGRHGN